MVPLIEHRDRNREDLNEKPLDTESPIQVGASDNPGAVQYGPFPCTRRCLQEVKGSACCSSTLYAGSGVIRPRIPSGLISRAWGSGAEISVSSFDAKAITGLPAPLPQVGYDAPACKTNVQGDIVRYEPLGVAPSRID